MADILGDLVMRIRGDASEGKEAIDDTKSGIRGLISPANIAKGAVMGVAGGIAHMGNQMVPLNQSLDRTAGLTDMNSDELRNLAGELTDVTFPLDEVTAGMEMLAQKGIENEDQMKSLLPTLDTLADSLDIDISQSIDKADGFMKAMGMTIEDLDEDHAELIHTMETLTDDGVAPLSRVMRQSGEEFKSLGLEGQQLAEVMVGLDRNTASSREATQLMRDAVEEAQGDQEEFRRIIENTTGDLSQYEDQISRASDSMEENADINNRNLTILDRARQRLQEVAFEYGEQLEAVREWSAGLAMSMPMIGKVIGGLRTMGTTMTTSVIPALKTKAAMITGTVIPALKAKAVALTGAVIPALKGLVAILATIGAPILAVIAIVTALIAIFHFFGDEIRDAVGSAVDWTQDKFNSLIDFLSGINLFEIGRNIMGSLADGIRSRANAVYDTVTNIIGGMTDRIKGFFGIRSPARLMIEYGENITEGLEEGIKGRLPELQVAAEQTGHTVSRGMGGQTDNRRNTGRRGPLLSIANLYVRDDKDIDKLARRIDQLQKKRDRRPVL